MSALIKKGIFAVSLFLGLVMVASPAQAQLGAAAGYNLDMFSSPSFSSNASNSFESGGGFSAGLYYNFPLGERLAVRPGLFVQQSSFEWQIEGNEPWGAIEDDLRVASIPIDVRYRFSVDQFTPYVLAGPGFNFVHTDQPDLRHVMSGQQTGSTHFVGLNVGAGIEIPVATLGLSLQPEIRYSHALGGFVQEDYIVRSVEYAADGSQRLNNLSFRLGISFLSIGFGD